MTHYQYLSPTRKLVDSQDIVKINIRLNLTMSVLSSNKEAVNEELKWMILKEENPSFMSKFKSKGISGILVPLSCVTTVGILVCGLNNFLKRDSKKQQIMMRYRVLAQGITIFLATFSVVGLKTK